MVEVVEFNGIRFRRYPGANQRSNRVYYTPGIADRQNGADYLHREIWKAAHGPIPRGHHIHHRDGDPLNNELDNLACVSPGEHLAEHWTEERAEASRAHMETIRPLTKEWHRSPEGRAWHREHGREAWESREAVERSCDQCGKSFESITRRDNDRFCSNSCKSAWRRDAGLDDEDRTCAACGKTWRPNKYSKARACSRKCAWDLRRSAG